jgi:murein DD-endopeptidase MepM/ murein hydrolase activator NlpD
MGLLMGIVRRGALAIAFVALGSLVSTMIAPTAALASEGDEEPVVTTTTTAPPVAVDPSTPATTSEGSEPPDTLESATPAPKPKVTRKFVPVKRYNVTRRLVFPVVGVTKFWDGFGGCRDNCTREHHGIDIVTYGWKGLPVVAAHDGTVVKVTYDEGNAGCSVRIRGRDRWETRYFHLNTDHPGSDVPGYPTCPAPGIEVGTQVVAGQIIGYIGDSGNAENTVPHLHFELRSPSGYPIDPYRSLKASSKVTFEWLPTDPQEASIELANATNTDTARVVVVVPSTEFHRLGVSETSSTILSAPMVVIDRDAPQAAIEAIERLEPERLIGLTDEDDYWLREALLPLAPIVAIDRITAAEPRIAPTPYDAVVATSERYVPDRFNTIIVGVVDKIRRSRQEAYDAFIVGHRSIVLTTERWAPRRVGLGSWTWPGKYADEKSLWWPSGDGWVATPMTDDAPDPGIAYVTEKLAQPQTLNFLGSLTELPPMPVWRSS